MTKQEVHLLIDAAIEGDISEADFLKLEAELSVDGEIRRAFYDRVLLTDLLLMEGAAQLDSDSPRVLRKVRLTGAGKYWRGAFAAMVALCASLVLLLSVQWQGRPETSALVTANQEQQSSGYAILSGQSDAIWANEKTIATGSIVPPGEQHLINGVAQFELFSGVTLVVQGDAKFAILSPMEVSVALGKVRANVPEPAQGFRLRTAAGEVVDLGTEFAVDVSADKSEVHVLDGKVDWHPNGLSARRLLQGDATRTTKNGQTSLPANEASFIGMDELQSRIRDRQSSRRLSWTQTSEALAKDQQLIAHYEFTPADVALRRLANNTLASNHPASNGAIVAAVAAQNRWGEASSALDFSPAGSRVRVQVPGEFENLSLVAWVRINSLDRWYNSLFLTDGHEQGEPHWQIMDDGRLFFSVKKNDVWDPANGESDKHVFYSPPFWNSSLSGRWLMLATVYNGRDRYVTHYLNGQVLANEKIPAEYLVKSIRIGDASLCNWGLPIKDKPHFAIRNLNGCMDEFLMFSTPLSDNEILKLYESSKP